MDIEKIIRFDWCNFEVEVPAITKKNKEEGYYRHDVYDKDVFWELVRYSDNVVIRYKNYLVSNKFVIDIKKEEFVFFPRSYNLLHNSISSIVIECYNSKYSNIELVHGVLSRFSRLYYELNLASENPKNKLKKILQDILLQHGIIKEDLLIQAIQKVINEESKENSENDCSTLQETCVEVF